MCGACVGHGQPPVLSFPGEPGTPAAAALRCSTAAPSAGALGLLLSRAGSHRRVYATDYLQTATASPAPQDVVLHWAMERSWVG